MQILTPCNIAHTATLTSIIAHTSKTAAMAVTTINVSKIATHTTANIEHSHNK